MVECSAQARVVAGSSPAVSTIMNDKSYEELYREKLINLCKRFYVPESKLNDGVDFLMTLSIDIDDIDKIEKQIEEQLIAAMHEALD